MTSLDCSSWILKHRALIDAWWQTNRDELCDLRRSYSWPAGETPSSSVSTREDVAYLVQTDAAMLGAVSRRTFERVLRWGFNNNDSALRASTDEQIATASGQALKALRADEPEQAAQDLGSLRGIGIASATKVLALAEPARFPIYDSRVGRGLRDLAADGSPLIPVPPSRSDPGTRSTNPRLRRGFAEVTCLTRCLAEMANIEGADFSTIASVSDLEMALFMRGAS